MNFGPGWRAASRRIRRVVLSLPLIWGAMAAMSAAIAREQGSPPLSDIADAAHVDLGSSGVLHYYIAYLPSGAAPDPHAVGSILIVIHGHPRDANRTLAAAVLGASLSGRAVDTAVVAPMFQVSDDSRCHFPGNPSAQSGDALWTCSSWLDGGRAEGGGPTSFAALDALVAHLAQDWPQVRTITVAGFSAGAQFVQRYIGFARRQSDVHVRYVVSDPGTWLYFDAHRPVPLIDGHPTSWRHCRHGDCDFGWEAGDAESNCPSANSWKYGTDDLPDALAAGGGRARERYAAADIAYLEGARDEGHRRDAYYKILDKSCAAELQGPDRLRRGYAYAAYDRRFLASDHRLDVVPDCAHDVTCIFPSAVARRRLFPE